MLDTIPAPLLDRMEVLEVSGYVSEEKAQIASRYLGPQAKEASGLKDADVELDTAAVDTLIKYYCRESGVRNLKKHIDKVRTCVPRNIGSVLTSCFQIYRKAALKIVQELGEEVFPEPTPAPQAATADVPSESKDTATVEKQDAPTNNPSAPETSTPNTSAEDDAERLVTTVERKPMKVPDSVHIKITPENLKDYVGPQVYQKDRLYVQAPPAGVSTGLGYLGNGSGAVMPIEALVSIAVNRPHSSESHPRSRRCRGRATSS